MKLFYFLFCFSFISLSYSSEYESQIEINNLGGLYYSFTMDQINKTPGGMSGYESIMISKSANLSSSHYYNITDSSIYYAWTFFFEEKGNILKSTDPRWHKNKRAKILKFLSGVRKKIADEENFETIITIELDMDKDGDGVADHNRTEDIDVNNDGEISNLEVFDHLVNRVKELSSQQ